MSLRHCEMHWLLLFAGDVQSRLSNRYNVSYLSLLGTLPTYGCQTTVLNILNTEAPPIDQNVSGL